MEIPYHPPHTSSHSWLDCPTLAACRPPISVGHQGNRATLEPEPGDIQPRLGLEDGGGSLKGRPAGSRNDWGPSPQLRLCTSPQALGKPMWGPATSFCTLLLDSHSPHPKILGVIYNCGGWVGSQRQGALCMGRQGGQCGWLGGRVPPFLLPPPSWQ